MLTNSKPFNQLKFSCTSVPSDIRLEISNKIKSMGGIYCNNLMSDVSILIVGDINTEKYRFSIQKRYDIVFIEPDTIFELHKKWVSGEDILTQVNNNYSLTELKFIPAMPPLKNIKICLSRISSYNRPNLISLINSNGGICTDSLATNTNFLVIEEKSGKRYEKALEWKIPVVHTQWIIDCIKRGGVLDGQYYNVRIKDPEQIGKGACLVWKELETIISKRRTDSKKRSSTKIEGDDNTQGENKDEEQEEVADNDIIRTKKNKSSLKAWNSIINNNDVYPTNSSNTGNASNSISENITALNNSIGQMEPSRKVFSFEGISFLIYGFNSKEKTTLIKIIKSYNGTIVDDLSEKISYIIMKNEFFTNKETLKHLKVEYPDIPVMTEWFIERCLYYNRIKEDIWGRPLLINDRLQDAIPAHRLSVSVSGFSGTELLHVEKMIKGLNKYIELSENLTKKTDFLIINITLVGLNRKNSRGLFEAQKEYITLLEDIECTKISLQSIKKKLVFCQNNNIPIYSLSFLFKLFFSELSSLNLSELSWCVYYPKKASGNNKRLEQFASIINGDNDVKSSEETTNRSISVTESKNYRTNKRHIKISGKASESSLSYNKENVGIVDSNLYDNPIETEKEEDLGTQISYGDGQSEDGSLTVRNRRARD